MQKINLHNYEAFLLDYLEGNLNDRDLLELKNFAVLHPELDIDLSADVLPVLNSDNNIFENKFLLNKNDDDLILNNWALNYIENILNTSEKTNFENELKTNLELQQQVFQFQKTKLVAELNTVYPNKEKLKKQVKVIVLFNFKTVSAIAAGLLLLVSLGFIFNYYFNTNKKVEGKIALQIKNKNNYSAHKMQSTNSVITNNVINNSSNNLIAKKSTNNFNQNQIRGNNTQTNSINSNTTKNIAFNNKINKDTISSINSFTNNAIAINTSTSNPVKYTNNFTSATTQTTLLVYEEDKDDTPQTNATPQKNNFWRRAVKVAKQLNGLGVKAIKGDEKSTTNYVLAFNSVSIEKK